MSTSVIRDEAPEARYRGLRLTADEYLQLEDDGFWYELIDGVVCMSPSPTPSHQKVATWIAGQITAHLDRHPLGEVFVEVDVHMGQGLQGGNLVYRPDVIFVRAERAAQIGDRIVGPPDLVVEVVSSSSRRFDSETKKMDYERCGVGEYWLIDPDRNAMTFHRLQAGRFVAITPAGERLESTAIPGFALDLTRLRRMFPSV